MQGGVCAIGMIRGTAPERAGVEHGNRSLMPIAWKGNALLP